ncbi:hypothetical protein Tsubulata_039755 [Turnera subulata]|uniref:Uncharacterized protein n=1 Tax=Turnera subulata TaxID=218843 RepID=A0A9Q0JSG8_9ROSI|nr:hypothetical protein Tsubulata_039755 [Turnera subulata]
MPGPCSITPLILHPLLGISSSEGVTPQGRQPYGSFLECVGVDLDPIPLLTLLSSKRVEEGKQVHVDVVKYGLDGDAYVNNNLVHFDGSCKKILDAPEGVR